MLIDLIIDFTTQRSTLREITKRKITSCSERRGKFTITEGLALVISGSQLIKCLCGVKLAAPEQYEATETRVNRLD